MNIEGYNIPDDLYYEKNHYWARVEGNLVVVGATDYTQKAAGDFVYVELPYEGDKVEQGKPFATIESGKWTGRIYTPVSGEIVEVNEDLEDDYTMINQDPYGEGWIVKIKPSNLEEELKNLLHEKKEVEEWMKKEIELHKAETG
ncbi:MAG: glycine cleavage system protein GcvH [Theionarchaea archaeon]|nr:MAG: glycine cleavage system protein H [Theionarchaea archaeon DG-70]MBU7010268.1 glycine cleavage system protein GcvH [Theionarchaea archaeon]